MEQFEPLGVKKRSGIIIGVVTVVALAIFGAGGYLAWSQRSGGREGMSDEFNQWCEIRKEWNRKIDPLTSDIMLKSVKQEDRPELEQLFAKRSKLCEEYARRVRELKISDPNLQAIEITFIKEGKVKANVSVEISNIINQLDAMEDMSSLRKARDKLRVNMLERIKEGKQAADQEIAGVFSKVKIRCDPIYHGPMTDEGTADTPYVNWDELEMRRSTAQGQFDEKMKKLEPKEEFANRVYHELVRQYRGVLLNCYKRTKARNPSVSDSMGLRIRLKPNGEVKTLAIEWMDNQDERLLDCMLEKAGKWRLPRPDSETEFVVVTVDFTKL